MVDVLLSLLLLVLFVVVVGKLSGRTLGIKLGRFRGVIVGTIGWAIGVVATVATIGKKTVDGGRTITIHTFADFIYVGAVVLFFGALAAMPVAIALDLVFRKPPGRRKSRKRAWLHPIRTVRRALAPYGRVREVIGHARRANLLRPRYATRAALESADTSLRLRTVIEDSGGMLVKLGQIASTRTDILPDALTAQLGGLRADVRAVAAEDIRHVLEDELGEPVEAAFASFEWTPLAAASIGQTHRAVLKDGTRVVVKVQRPGIGDIVARDASVLRLISRQLERRVAAAREIGIRALAEELIAGLEEELDYELEASAGMGLRERRASDVGVSVPLVHTSLSTSRVLVMEEVVGRSIDEPGALDDAPVPRAELGRRVLSSFLGQVLQDGVFHADPHPGNLLIDTTGTIWMLDFGSVGRLDGRAREGLRGIAVGVAADEPGMLARSARDLAGGDTLVDLRSLEADITVQLGALDAAGGIDPRLIGGVLQVMQKHGLRPPSSITLLARALFTLEGTIRLLAPELNLNDAAQELALGEHREAFGTPRELLQKEALRQLPTLRTLPEHAEALANQLRAGRLVTRSERYAGGDREIVDEWIDRAVVAGVGGFGVIGSSLLLAAAASTSDDKIQTTLWILGFSGLLCGTVLLMRSAARSLRRHFARIE
ncbi:MAG TPA: AarF/UbiB family protein [Frankiaceae bacterium]|jgi:ubiquinone biosynthesis protein|nr:AarF/UbiB family protein [Frankiaceae bacterium]